MAFIRVLSRVYFRVRFCTPCVFITKTTADIAFHIFSHMELYRHAYWTALRRAILLLLLLSIAVGVLPGGLARVAVVPVLPAPEHSADGISAHSLITAAIAHSNAHCTQRRHAAVAYSGAC
eukprot:SAG11_NODE_1979_length_3971_cov_2.010331_2_plen_121_part_00